MELTSKRDVLKGMALVAGGAVALGAGATMGARPAAAQAIPGNGGLDPESVLAKVRSTGKLSVGYAQTPLWFYRDLKSGELRGVYKDLIDDLARDMEAEVEFKEVDFATATVALRNGDYDVFGASLAYTPPRALTIDYVGPLWSKGNVAITHKDFLERFSSPSDFNDPDVIFSQGAGQAEESRVRALFPKAQMITTSGQLSLAMEPIRAKRAHLFMGGEMDAQIFVKNNPWAAIVAPDQPFDRRPNTWAIRYGDTSWKSYLETWTIASKESGRIQQVYDKYVEELLDAS
ncbi:substrate-binding periplasmic protein [Acuticoccus kandeliae]|uniref:substrate-binding periplasmic protein n=1 Tax=Acuticoccus kandeliae TaxID=2073160 RepID=UPI000E3DCD64|nr:transporter substrate-binding domain-containing protein [Acuticoccus kandeliae]